MSESSCRRFGPVVQLCVGTRKKGVERIDLVPGNLGGQFGKTLVDPRILTRVLVEVYGVLKFVGQDGHIYFGAGREQFGVQIYDLTLVAVRMHVRRVLVARAIVPGGSVQRGMQDNEARVSVNAGTPYIAESSYHRRTHLLLEQSRSFLEACLIDGYGVVNEPVGIVANHPERRADFCGRAVVEVGQPEAAPVSDRHRLGGLDRAVVNHHSLKPHRELTEVPVGWRELNERILDLWLGRFPSCGWRTRWGGGRGHRGRR